MMLRAVLFDLDGVLTTDKTGSVSTVRSLAAHTGLEWNALWQAYTRHNRALLYGKITHEDMWVEMCREVGREIDFALLHTAFVETPIDADMLDLLRSLRAQGVLTGLVTDNKADRIRAILTHHDLYGAFDAISVSAEVGSGKRERAIFDHALAQLPGVKPEECAFIDNTAANLVVPGQMGMRTVLFDDERRDADGIRGQLGDNQGIISEE